MVGKNSIAMYGIALKSRGLYLWDPDLDGQGRWVDDKTLANFFKYEYEAYNCAEMNGLALWDERTDTYMLAAGVSIVPSNIKEDFDDDPTELDLELEREEMEQYK